MATIESLPPEILVNILFFLDTDPPFPQLVYEYPEKIITMDGLYLPIGPHVDFSLQSASQVNHKWRQICFPILFRHIKWTFARYASDNERGGPEHQLLHFLRDHECHRMSAIVESITIITLKDPWGFEGFDVFDPPDHVLERSKGIWTSIFSIVDPLRVTFIGDPCVTAIITSLAPIPGASSWMFELSDQILQLSRPSRSQPHPLPSDSPSTTDLFALRPWTEFLINEGSFLKNYTTYEYHNNLPPCLLKKIFAAPATRLPHLSKFSYISIFPTAAHFDYSIIPYFPGVQSLYMQIAPKELDFTQILGKGLLGHLDLKDPWMENHDVAMEVKLALFDKNHHHASKWEAVQRFETNESYNASLYDTVSEGISEEFLNDVNYRQWEELRRTVLVRANRP